jgi:DNA recombination protein Rad52
MFTQDQRDMLIAPLARDNVKTRSQSGRGLSYIEGWKCIEEANRIFGFDCWTRETVELKMVSERERQIRNDKGWSVSYIARCRITVFSNDGGGSIVIREGIGAGHGIDRSLGLAHESAAKEAETDAMKRALMTFGYPFGLALYDKDQEHVTDANGDTEGGPHEDWSNRRGDELVRAARAGAQVAKRNGNEAPRQISSGDERVGPDDDMATTEPGDFEATRSTLKATYLASARDLIRKAANAEELRAWWFSTESQKARTDFELNAMELKDLSQFCKSRIDQLMGRER